MTLAPKPGVRDPRVWTSLGEMRPAPLREFATRVRAGQDAATIAKAIGINVQTARKHYRTIGKAMGIPSAAERHAIVEEEVSRRVFAGETTAQIAETMGRTTDSVASIRRKLSIGHGRKLRLSDTEEAEVRHMLLEGKSTRAVARAVGCEQADVARRLKRISHLIPTDLPPCGCGKPNNHGGRCNLVVDSTLIRDRLLAGLTATYIAREFDRTAQSFKPKYIDPVIAELTVEGHVCKCGKPFGHQFVCAATMAVQRRTFTNVERNRATVLLAAGASVANIKADLGIATNSARILTHEIRATLAQDGARCPCGAPIDHSLSCSARNGVAKSRTAFRFSCAAARSMSDEARRRVSRLARQGWPVSVIVKRTSQSVWRVSQMVEELAAAGVLPAKCAGCDQSRGHRAPCPLPTQCKCGRSRNHRGLCRSPDGRKRVPFTKLPPEKVAEIKAKFRARTSIREISRSTGVPFGGVQRLVNLWREKSKYVHRPCECGRPAFHPGGCEHNTPGGIGKRWIRRIETGILAGQTFQQVADDLDMSPATVAKHSLPARERLFALGTTCACGRMLNHNYWCSATWDLHGQPRGRIPLPRDVAQRVHDGLLRGDLVADIAASCAISVNRAWVSRQELSADESRRRARVMRDRQTSRSNDGAAEIMAEVQAAVPRGIDPIVRDDIVGELVMARMEGRVEAAELKKVVRNFIAQGLTQWSGRYQKSADAPFSADNHRTLADSLSDDTTAGTIEQFTIGTAHIRESPS